MFDFPVQYSEPLFRPPSEANSVIIQASLGCSWNRCAFCDMYKSKKYIEKDINDIESDIVKLSKSFPKSRKFFIADGDALAMPIAKLIDIIRLIKFNFKQVQRISSYASVRNIADKSSSELAVLQAEGLQLLYIGLESGDEELLTMVNKGETYDRSVTEIRRVQEIGLDTSVMIINGLGGKLFSKSHALNSARLINDIEPKYLSLLCLYHPKGVEIFKKRFKGDYTELNPKESMEELLLFMENLELENTIFRSDHVSNSLVLKGILGRNKTDFLLQIKDVLRML